MRVAFLASFITALLVLEVANSNAFVIIDAVETGGDVVFSGSGSVNTTDLTFSVQAFSIPAISPGLPLVRIGPSDFLEIDSYSGAISVPPGFGVLFDFFADSGTGDRIGATHAAIEVPAGYASGDPLSGSMTSENATFDTLDIIPGTCVWEWGSRETADSFTLNVIPEPSTVLLSALALGSVGARRRRMR